MATPPSQEVLTVVVAQGARLGDATRNTFFGGCRGFLKAEEGAKGQGSSSLSLPVPE